MAALTQEKLKKRWQRHVHLQVCALVNHITGNTFPDGTDKWTFCRECTETRCLKYPTRLMCDRHTAVTVKDESDKPSLLGDSFQRIMELFPFDALDFESRWTEEKWASELKIPTGNLYNEFVPTSKYIFSDMQYYRAIYRRP